MQRWMQAKDQLGKLHGFARSGAGRPMGYVSEDRKIGADKEDLRPAVNPRPTACHGRLVATVSPVIHKVNGTLTVRKPLDKLPRKLREKLERSTPLGR